MNQAKTVYLVSDLHLGQGRNRSDNTWHVLEDFRVDEAFSAFIDHISASQEHVELVIAGDFIEYLQILPELGLQAPRDHLGLTEHQSLQRTFVVLGQSNVATGHPEVFAALRRFMQRGNSLTMLAGNHDIDLLWPRVWLLLYYNICPPGSANRFRLEPFSYTIGSAPSGRIYIEHGHEHDRANRFGNQMQEPFVYDAEGTKRLKRCWGTLFVDKVYNQLEEQCWFIDNIKPISRVIKMGLKGDFVFTATAMALLAKFFLTKGTPMLGGLSFGTAAGGEAEQPTVEQAINAVEDEELRTYLGMRLVQDPSFRAEFAQEVQHFSTEEQRAMEDMQAGAEELEWEEPLPETVSFGLAERVEEETAYQKAAREVMEQDASISTVVMGHTHHAIDRLPLTLSDGRTGYFFNSGTWTPRLIERTEPYTWEELEEAHHYTSSLDYLRFTPDENGEYHAELRSWIADAG